MTNEKFKKISSIGSAHEAWTILQKIYEDTKAVKDSKLQRLTTSFEEIRMDDDEVFEKFYAKLKDIVNFAECSSHFPLISMHMVYGLKPFLIH